MNQEKSNIQILVVSHKPSFVPENSLLKPIQVGTELAANKLEGMAYYDNQGENISSKNGSYCELTAIYWAWKNLDADYYGLFHYRRYLSFSSKQHENPYAGKAFPTVQAALSEIELDEAHMRKTIESHDIILPRKDDTRGATNDKSLYEQYKSEHYIEDLDICIQYIQEKYPHLAPFIETLHGSEAYFCNMFIMKKAIFNDYCSFIFDVLGHFDEAKDISDYNLQQYRVNGFLAERLTNLYIHYLQSLGRYKVKELQMTYFENTNPEPRISPVSKENNVAVVLAANNYYVPYISTLIRSIANHASDKYTYDINIFHQDITPRSMALLKNEFADHKNISIRFCDMSSRAAEYSSLFTKWHFTVETYFRLFIQDVMSSYDKVLYLDGDMIVKSDIAKLYSENLDGYMLAAARDLDMAGVYKSGEVAAENTIDPKRRDYIDHELKLKNPYDYFQAGVIVFNLKEMRKTFSPSEALKFAASRQWEYLDQDVLNYFAQGRVKFLDLAWNVLYDWEFVRIANVISKAPIESYRAYMESRKDPKIIHYGGTIKPWQRADVDFAEHYWEVARQSVFYELILSRMATWAVEYDKKKKHSHEYIRLRTRAVRKMRHMADKVAPMGTTRRKPITFMSKVAKKVLR